MALALVAARLSVSVVHRVTLVMTFTHMQVVVTCLVIHSMVFRQTVRFRLACDIPRKVWKHVNQQLISEQMQKAVLGTSWMSQLAARLLSICLACG